MLKIQFLTEERKPVSSAVLKASVILCGAVPLLIAYRSGVSPDALSLTLTIIAAALAFLGWNMNLTAIRDASDSKTWMIVLAASALVASSGLFMRGSVDAAGLLWVVLLPVLIGVTSSLSSETRVLRHILVPLSFGAIFMFTSGALGVPSIGAFPAVIGALFIAVLRATLDIEEDIFENHADVPHIEVEKHYRHRLAITAVIFFLFGTVSLWPWLGDMYGKGYFWLLLLGVLLPLAFFWGRIRQPKLEGAKTALIRFNRIAPVLGLIHVVAFIAS